MAPVKNGQRQAWIPDGSESVITILWCKMRHWWNEILLQLQNILRAKVFVYLAEGPAVALQLLSGASFSFSVSAEEFECRGRSAPSDCSNVGVGVCPCLCGMVITRLIKNRREMDKDS